MKKDKEIAESYHRDEEDDDVDGPLFPYSQVASRNPSSKYDFVKVFSFALNFLFGYREKFLYDQSKFFFFYF